MNEELKLIISAEVAKFKQGMQQADAALTGLVNKTQKASKEVKDNISKMGDGIKSAASKMGTGFAAIGAAMTASNVATVEYRQSMAQLNTSYEELGLGTKAAGDTFKEFYRLMGETDTAAEASALLGQLAKDEQSLNEWTTICAGAMAKFPDSLPIESLVEAANETAKTGVLTGALTDAINWCGLSEEKFQKQLDACNTEAEREALIRETLNEQYGEAGEKYKENTDAIGNQREAQLNLMNTISKLGEALAPVLTAFMNFATQALQPVIDKIAPLAEQYAPQLQSALEAAGEAVNKAFGFFVDNWEIFAGIGAVIAGIAAAIGLYNVVAAIKAAMDAAQVTTLGALTAAMWANVAATAAALAPYLLIVAAIAAVIAIIVLCVKNWDTIKAKVKEVAEAIWKKVKEMVDKVVQFFTELGQKISEKVESIKAAAVEKFQAIKDGISQKAQAAKDAVVNTFENIKSSMQSKIDSAKSTVLGIFDSIKTGIKSKIDGARDAVKTAIDKIKGFFNFKWELPKLKMPSIGISGKFSLNPPSVPKFTINWNALGGVFTHPTIVPYGSSLQGLGEQGAEAIVPLEKNTQWLDKIAEKLGAGQSAQIVLQIDSKTLAQTVITSINNLTRQQGKLSLNLI